MKRCTLCLVPDTRPDSKFTDGVCSACLSHEARKTIDWEQRERALLKTLDRAHSNAQFRGVPYDVIVPSSGGKDSTYQVATMLQYGMRPLVVTASTCQLTEIGRRNIDNLSRLAPTIEVTPNRTVRAKLNRMSLQMLGDISWPEHVLIHTVPFTIARHFGVPLVLYGENPLAQYGSPRSDAAETQQMTRGWVSEFGGFLGMRPSDFVGMDGISEGDMSEYIGPTDDDLETSAISVCFLGQFLPWDSHRNAEVARAHGFWHPNSAPGTANYWFAENWDNAQTGIHDYFAFLKYGMSRACVQLSVDIRNGRIERELALNILKGLEFDPYPHEYAGTPLRYVLSHIGMTIGEFEAAREEHRGDW